MSVSIAITAGPAPAGAWALGNAAPLEPAAPALENTEETAEDTVTENWELVRAAQSGDSDAFGQLYDRYVDWVYRYALLRVGDRHLAEDVTSETFLRALRRITSVTYQGRDVGAWFTTIARNIVLDHVKSSRHRLEVVTDEVAEPGSRSFSGPAAVSAPGPEQQAISRSVSDELLRCVGDLCGDQRECIILRFIQGYSVAETAAIMERNVGAVKALQHRAVRRLAKLLPAGLH